MYDNWWVKVEDLDDDQKTIIELPGDGSFLITGPPGSGKTNLLLLRATYMVRAGNPNLVLLVFTRTLQEFTRSGSANYSFPIQKIQTYIHWGKNFLWEYGVEFEDETDFIQQRKKLTEKLLLLINEKSLSNIYDVILLDEAQDYLPNEIRIFDSLATNIFAVGDSNQKIYNGVDPIELIEEIVDNHHHLRFHYRNGLNICRFSDEISKSIDDSTQLSHTCNYDEEKIPSSIELIQCDNIEHQCQILVEKIRYQIEAYPNELIGLITPRRRELSIIWDYLKHTPLYDKCVLQSSDSGYTAFSPEMRVCVCTIHSAKGLEFRALHIAGSEFIKNFPLQRNIAFTACTRAKTSLCIYFSDPIPGFIEGAYSAVSPPQELPVLDDLFQGEI